MATLSNFSLWLSGRQAAQSRAVPLVPCDEIAPPGGERGGRKFQKGTAEPEGEALVDRSSRKRSIRALSPESDLWSVSESQDGSQVD